MVALAAGLFLQAIAITWIGAVSAPDVAYGTLVPAFVLGGIGMATWTGVRLSTVLQRSGLVPGAVDVMATGLDDPYVVNRCSELEIKRVLERPEVVTAVGDDIAEARAATGDQSSS